MSPVHLVGLGAAGGMAHHLADQESHRLAVAGRDLLADARIVGQHPVQNRLQRGGVGDLAQAVLRHHRPRVAVLLDHRLQHLLGDLAAHRTRSQQLQQRRQPRRCQVARGQGLPAPVEVLANVGAQPARRLRRIAAGATVCSKNSPSPARR